MWNVLPPVNVRMVTQAGCNLEVRMFPIVDSRDVLISLVPDEYHAELITHTYNRIGHVRHEMDVREGRV